MKGFRFEVAFVAFAVIFALAGKANAQTNFAIVGDYGANTVAEGNVANLIASWNPDFIVTTGDNNYETGSASTIDTNIGKYYHSFIFPYTGTFGQGATENRFFPAPGNHDWGNVASNPTGLNPFLAYFQLPGNERYYDFARGPVRFFILDSDTNEPDGMTSNSVQAGWLQARLSSTLEPWKIVVFHHPAYSSSQHGSTLAMRWPFAAWGASLVIAGHDHSYERLSAGGLTYMVNGLGGKSIYTFGTPLSQSQFRFNDDYGAQKCTAWNSALQLSFITRAGLLIERFELSVPPPIPENLAAKSSSLKRLLLKWDDVAIGDPVQYKVFRKSNIGSPWVQIGSTASNQFEDNLWSRTSTSLLYAVSSIGPTGAESELSNPLRIVIR